jgi:hypothetical protein
MAFNTASTPTRSSSTPTFPVPASARVHPATTVAGTTTPPKVTLTPTTSPATTTPPTTSVPAASVPAGAATTIPTTTVKAVIAGQPATHTAKHSESLSAAAIAAAVIAAVLVLACIAWALARRRAFEPHWLLSLRHAMAEAGFRASATWAEFSDWARLGR